MWSLKVEIRETEYKREPDNRLELKNNEPPFFQLRSLVGAVFLY